MNHSTAAVGTLRKAQWRDVDRLLALHRIVLSRLSRAEYDDEQVNALLTRLPSLDRHLIGEQTYFVVEAADTVVACGGWSWCTPGYVRMMRGEDHPDTHPRVAYIRAMYTHPEWTRRGLGRRIIEASEREIRAAGRRLVVLDAMLTGVPLFRAANYRNEAAAHLDLGGGVAIPLLQMSKVIA